MSKRSTSAPHTVGKKRRELLEKDENLRVQRMKGEEVPKENEEHAFKSNYDTFSREQ